MNHYEKEVPADVRSTEVDRVFEVALSLVPAAQAFGRKFQLDSDAAHNLMMDAAKRVVESQVLKDDKVGVRRIKNLPAYLFTVARNLMFAELKRRKDEISIDEERGTLNFRERLQSDTHEIIENKILLSEIVKQMSPKARTIFTYRSHGYAYEEIAAQLNIMGDRVTAASLRSELSKAISRITRELKRN